MHKIMRLLVYVTVYLFPYLLFAQDSEMISTKTNYSPEIEARIKQVEEGTGIVRYTVDGVKNLNLEQRMQKYHINGITVAVINNYQVEWVKGYGWADTKERRPVTTETLFQPGSISKSLNAVGVMKLVQDKKLDLQTDINDYLRSWKFPYDSVSKGKKITIANLLSHTAGLSVHGFPGYFYHENKPTLHQILDGEKPAKTRAVRSMFEPGLRFQYSGGGTMISEQILLDFTGKPYDEFIAETVFKPMGMTRSFFTQPPPVKIRSQLATGYQENGTKTVSGNYPLLLEQAAGGLWTTPSDLAKYIIDIQLSYQGKSNKVLNKETTQLMLTPYIDKSAALGVFIDKPNGGTYFQHSAGNLGFSGRFFGSLDEGKGVVIFMNADYGYQLIDEFINSVAFVYKWKGMYDEKAPVVVKERVFTPRQQDNIAGVYVEDNGMFVEVERKDGSFDYSAGWSGPWTMYFTSPDKFINIESKSEKEFITDSAGNLVLTRSLDGKRLSTARRLNTIQVQHALLQKYEGTYKPGEGGEGRLLLKEGRLWLDDGNLKKIHFISEKEFIVLQNSNTYYTIILNAAGKVEGLSAKQGDRVTTINKVK